MQTVTVRDARVKLSVRRGRDVIKSWGGGRHKHQNVAGGFHLTNGNQTTHLHVNMKKEFSILYVTRVKVLIVVLSDIERSLGLKG